MLYLSSVNEVFNKMSQTKARTAISPTREENFPEWYQQVIKAADLAENSPVRGCMTIKPWGYGIWENLQRQLDDRIKATGHDNAYFPLFIPLSYLEKEADHVEGFAKECAVVTHHRLEEKDGRLIPSPDAELEEPLVVRPTSEAVIGASFSRWIESHRDMPLLINQWANVVRWEMRPRLFLRTAEFLWQEGHTAHSTEAEAQEESLRMLEVYREFVENVLAIPLVVGEKSPGERFPGADNTYCIEAMMQDRKAVQAGTSHYLGQNFSKGFDITFTNKNGEVEHAYTTSWGVSTRLIGSMIMAHGDDDGMRVPPRVAPKHVVIIPVIPKPEMEEEVLAYAEKVAQALREAEYAGEKARVQVDKREMRGGEKTWHWIKKGIPLRIEVGPRDIAENKVMVSRRDQGPKDKHSTSLDALPAQAVSFLEEIQSHYFNQAKEVLETQSYRDISTLEEMREFFTPKDAQKPEIHGGFVYAKWCGDPATEELLKEMKVTIRCLPLEQSGTTGKCIITGREATLDAVFAKAY